MRTTLALLFSALALPALAAPACYTPRSGAPVIQFSIEIGKLGEADRAAFYELQLRARGYDARDTRIWQGCIQTFVTENGHFTMRFFDPYTLEEIPVN
jgi:hypothetical protein